MRERVIIFMVPESAPQQLGYLVDKERGRLQKGNYLFKYSIVQGIPAAVTVSSEPMSKFSPFTVMVVPPASGPRVG